MRSVTLLVLFVASPLLAEEPKTASDFYSRALDRHSKKEYAKAIEDFNEAIKLNPKEKYYPMFRILTWEALKEYDKALSDAELVAKLDPEFPIHSLRGRMHLGKKNYDLAIKDYAEAIKQRGNDQIVLASECMELAWIYACCPDEKYRDGKQAVELAKKAIEYSGARDHWKNRETLAAAYAETGEFKQAVAEQKLAYDMLMKVKDPKTGDPDITAIKKAIERHKLYQSGKPYRLETSESQK